MNFNVAQYITSELPSIQLMLLLINALLHVIFAGAVAKDVGTMSKLGRHPHLVSGVTWAFATLIGGPLIAVGYWFMHHLRPYSRSQN
jgi:uncharacterized membrane protein